jgi:hypothetical protein
MMMRGRRRFSATRLAMFGNAPRLRVSLLKEVFPQLT